MGSMRNPVPFPNRPSSARLLCALVAVAFLTSGCDPVINFYGSFFPAWVICVISGVLLTVACRWLFVVTRLEAHLGPLALVYPALAFMLTGLTWLFFFGP